MDNYNNRKLGNQIKKIDRTLFNTIKHKLMFGGVFTSQEEVIAQFYIRTGRIGRQFIRNVI